MYTTESIEKFLKENPDIPPEKRAAIRARTREFANSDGIIASGQTPDLFSDSDLLRRFRDAFQDSEHGRTSMEVFEQQ